MADNIKVKNIYYMLSYVWHGLRETGFENVAAEDFENIHDLFSAILIQGVGDQIKRGLYRDYIAQEEPLSVLQGKINIAESIKKQTLIQKRLVCVHDEFTENLPHNQVLKSTIYLLLRHGNVKKKNKSRLRKLLLYFSSVTDISPVSICWNKLKYHRNNSEYRMLIDICQLTVKGLLLTTETGSYTLAGWLSDKLMHNLYERFVLSYFQAEHQNISPRSAYISWDIPEGTDSTYLPAMKSDITLTNGSRTLIIDTKWYEHTMQTHTLYNSSKFISHHLYQIFTYVKNMDKGAAGNTAGVLLYAKSGEGITPDGDFRIGGSRISLKTLDLDREWGKIRSQLDELCLWLS